MITRQCRIWLGFFNRIKEPSCGKELKLKGEEEGKIPSSTWPQVGGAVTRSRGAAGRGGHLPGTPEDAERTRP